MGGHRNGECGERRLTHSDGEAEKFYRELKQKGVKVRVGMEPRGTPVGSSACSPSSASNCGWATPPRFKADAGTKAEERSARCRTLSEAAGGKSLSPGLGAKARESRCTATGVAPTSVGGDANTSDESAAGHRHERRRAAQARAMEQARTGTVGVVVADHLDQSAPARTARAAGPLDPSIDQLSQAIEQEAERRPEVQRLQTHPGVGPITALAFVLIIGTPDRFPCGKQVGSYLGLIPCEDSSADSRRLGHISKQGNALLRFLLVASGAKRRPSDEQWRRQYAAPGDARESVPIAKVAMARKLAVRLFWMWRRGWDYQQLKKFGSHVG